MSKKIGLKPNGSHRIASHAMPSLDLPSILQQHLQGNTRSYDALLEMLSKPELQSEDLIRVLRSVRGNITSLGQQHEQLVGTLMKINWPHREEKVIKEYRMFLLNLLSAHTFYLRAGLRMLVSHLLPDSSTKEADEATKASDKTKFINIHLVLRAVGSLIPMTWSVLMPLLCSSFPYVLRPLYHLECYVTNLLRIPAYMPKLRQPILELIVNKLIQLDVRCPRADIEASEDDDMDQDVFDMDPDCDMEDGGRPSPMKHVDAHKLDVLMEILLTYIHDSLYKQEELDWDACKQLYRELLLVFEKMVLPTYASGHTQFFMFYICSLRQSLADGFIDYLWKKFQNPNTQTVFRQAAVGYIGSFISRAKYIPVSTVKTCLELTVGWVHRYLEKLSGETLFADIAHHAPFYSICQAIFYIFCFRSKEIINSSKGYKWAESLHLQKIVTSRLNPLRLCLPIVVKTFSSVTRSHQLVFCDTIIERNKRYTLQASSQNEDGFAVQSALLDSFFPFDPYLLNRSGIFILPLYRDYEGSNLVVDTDPDQETQMEDDDFLTEGRTGNVEVPGTSLKSTLSPDFLQYGTSPGFKHI